MAAAAQGEHISPETLEALDWLEKLPHPVIAAPQTVTGQRYDVFVPNNDLDAKLSGKSTRDIEKAKALLRVKKHMKPVLFDMDTPILYCWSISGQPKHAMIICKIAESIYQLGRGIDMAWAEAAVVDTADVDKQLLSHGGIIFHPSGGHKSSYEFLCPCPGSRRSLTDRFDKMRRRFLPSSKGSATIFVQAPKPIFAKVAYNLPSTPLIYELREVDAESSFVARVLSESVQLVTEVRDRLAKRMVDGLPDQKANIERYVIGRNATNADKIARIKIVPIPSIGHPQSDMMVRRLAVYVPQLCPLSSKDLAWALAQVGWIDENGIIASGLQCTSENSMVKRYEKQERSWQSVTPLALQTMQKYYINFGRSDTEAKSGTERAKEEAYAIHAVRQALVYAGVSTPPITISVQREPFDSRGKRAELFATSKRFPKEILWHVSIMFSEPITGPLLLGDGRYLGLGLMKPSESKHGILAFSIKEGLTDTTTPLLVTHAARRAMIARVRDICNQRSLPTYVTGHDADGSPARSGVHRHIAIVADFPRRRFLYIAPNWLQRHVIRWQEVSKDHALVEQALRNMKVLLAGQAGRLVVTPAAVDLEYDPLFAPAQAWESVNDYHVTRHHRRLIDAEALKVDVLAELRRRCWPIPKSIKVLSVQHGPRGSLSGRLHIAFATSQSGPLLLGRTAHRGGGLFSHSAPEDK